MPRPTNCLRHRQGCGSALEISSPPKAATPKARASSTQSKSAMYLRLMLNIKLNVRPGVWRPESGVRSSPPPSEPRLPSHYFQPLSLQASHQDGECDGSNL